MPSKLYELACIAAPAWFPAFGFPESKYHRNLVGMLDPVETRKLEFLAADDIRQGAPKFRKIMYYTYVLENKLMRPDLPKDLDSFREMLVDYVLFFAAKYLIRDVYSGVAMNILGKVVSDEKDMMVLLKSARPEITSVFGYDPRYTALVNESKHTRVGTLVAVPRNAVKIHRKKYSVLRKYVLDAGLPPERVLRYVAALYVLEESVAFSHREDLVTFYAEQQLLKASEVLGINETQMVKWVVYDGRKVV